MFFLHDSLSLVHLDLTMGELLLFDAFLSLLFFFQHSLLVRKNIRERITRLIPDEYYGALYSISSGIFLLPVILFWQKTPQTLVEADAWLRTVLQTALLLAACGFFWGAYSLKSMIDPFGVKALIGRTRSGDTLSQPLKIRGAYLWMRHPLYFFVLVMIWACPVITPDRLLFNIIWSVWIVIGTFLEERDLVRDFGEQYRKYQSRVPMLIPCRIPREALP